MFDHLGPISGHLRFRLHLFISEAILLGHLRFRLRGHLGPSVALKAILDSDCDSVARPSWATYVTYNTKGMNTKHTHNRNKLIKQKNLPIHPHPLARHMPFFPCLLVPPTAQQQASRPAAGPRGRPAPPSPSQGESQVESLAAPGPQPLGPSLQIPMGLSGHLATCLASAQAATRAIGSGSVSCVMSAMLVKC